MHLSFTLTTSTYVRLELLDLNPLSSTISGGRAGGLGERFRRLVIVSGVSGVELGRILDLARREFRVPVAKLEDYIEDEFHAPIYEAVELLLTSRQASLGRFRRALDSMLESFRDNKAVVGVHLTYHRRNHIIPNPLLWGLVASAYEAYVILYIEDYYHALARIAERVLKGRTPGAFSNQPLDPLGYLYWRASDYATAFLLEGLGNVRVMVYGVKHSLEGHRRLLAYALDEPLGGLGRFKNIYVSHPITKVRARALESNGDLWSFEDCIDIERFKAELESRCGNVIVHSPTTVDELIAGRGDVLKSVIERRDRWPHPEVTLHEYTYPVDLTDPKFNELYNVSKTTASPGYMEALKAAIETQVESRDLAYVNQVDFVVAYRPTLYGTTHTGVEVEVEVAQALSKPVYSIIPEGDRVEAHPLRRYGITLKSEDSLYTLLKCSA
jgi:hypothetical protein